MGTAVPLEAQEGNKYILTLIMKAIVAYALAAFAAIASNSIEATPVPSPVDLIVYPPTDPYAVLAHKMRLRRSPYEVPAQDIDLIDLIIDPNDYAVLARERRHADKQHRLTKREEYPEEYAPQYYSHLEEARLTKREDLDTYLDAEADP